MGCGCDGPGVRGGSYYLGALEVEAMVWRLRKQEQPKVSWSRTTTPQCCGVPWQPEVTLGCSRGGRASDQVQGSVLQAGTSPLSVAR